MENFFAKTNHVTELIFWNLVVCPRAKSRLGVLIGILLGIFLWIFLWIFLGNFRDLDWGRLVGFRGNGLNIRGNRLDIPRTVISGQRVANESGEAREKDARRPKAQTWRVVAHGFDPCGVVGAAVPTGRLA